MKVLCSKVRLPDDQIRTAVDEQGLASLKRSMQELGLINPIVCRKVGDEWEIITGARRFMAAGSLGWESIPVSVVKVGDEKAEKMKVAENRDREDVDAIDEGLYFLRMMAKQAWTQKQLASAFGYSEGYVSQRIRAVQWPDCLKDAVRAKLVTFSVARELGMIEEPAKLQALMMTAVNSGVSPRVAAQWRQEANRKYVPGDGEPVSSQDNRNGSAQGHDRADCQMCGRSHDYAEVRYLAACKLCQALIKNGQEQGVFSAQTVAEGGEA